MPERSLLYLASIDFPQEKARAIQIVNTCHALARAGCRVTLVVGRRKRGSLESYLHLYGLQADPNLRLVGLPVLRLPANTPARLRAWYTHLWNWSYLIGCLALLPLLLRTQPAALLARDYRLAWLLIKLSGWHRARVVFEAHGLPSAELLDQAGGGRTIEEARRRRKLEQAVFEGSWRVLTITDCLRTRLIRDYGVPEYRVCTVPDASRAPRPSQTLESSNSSERSRRDGGPNSHQLRRLIYVGQLYPWKGVGLAVRALAEVPGAQLTIVGGLSRDPHRTRLKQLAADLGLEHRIQFEGPHPYSRVADLLSKADIAVLPLADTLVARCFTSPLKLFDYLSAGLPIVAVDFPTIREVLRDGHNALLVRPNDPSAIADALNRLINDPGLAAALARQARHDAADHTWERRAQRVLAALTSHTPASTPAFAG